MGCINNIVINSKGDIQRQHVFRGIYTSHVPTQNATAIGKIVQTGSYEQRKVWCIRVSEMICRITHYSCETGQPCHVCVHNRSYVTMVLVHRRVHSSVQIKIILKSLFRHWVILHFYYYYYYKPGLWWLTMLTHWGLATEACISKLTHWGRVTHICVSKLTTIGSYNGLSPGRRQTIIWTNAGILLIWPLGTNCSEILIAIKIFSLKKMRLKTSSGKWPPSCLGLNELSHRWLR